MHTKIIFFTLVFCLLTGWSYATEAIAGTEQVAISDSLLETFEKRVEEEYGINENSTLLQVAEVFAIDISVLKKQLNLDARNTKLNKMRLKALGISTYQALLAQQSIQYGFNEASSLEMISAQLSIPIKKLKSLLKLDPLDRSLNGRTVESLDLSLDYVAKAKQEFDGSLYQIGTSITIVGMLVVFTSLFITSLVILLLKYVDVKPKAGQSAPDIKLTKSGKVLSANANISNNEIIAAITALHIYTYQLEERRRINLTFHRTKANFWHASGYSEMPNRLFSRRTPK